ncbi:Cu/Ag efflux pump CusA [Bradyrhizobium sp. LB7.2]
MTVALSRLLGLEFLPKLEEGNLWIRATLPPTISLQEGNSYVNEMRKVIRARPEVESVVSQHGRPDDGTDAAGFFNAEFFAPLKPASQWPGTRDKEELTAQLLKQLDDRFPGVEFNFSQYLQDNVSEAVSGVKGENSIKLFGSDLQALTDTANKIKSVLATVQGVTDLAVFTSLGQPTIQIDINRAKAARYGLAPGDINATIKVAIGGDTAGDIYEAGSDRHFSDHRSPCAGIPQERRSDSEFADRRPRAERHRHADTPERGRHHQPRLGRGLHLSRTAGTLSADQVLGA